MPKRQADHLSSDIFLPDEALAIRREARAFADEVLAPAAHRMNCTPESAEAFPRTEFEAMARAGLYEIPCPAEAGGRGLAHPTLATVTVLEELGYYARGFASALYDGQAILVGKTLEHAQEPLRSHYLPRLMRGELVGCFATSEPEASTDLSVDSLQTVAERADGGWRINGTKRWITNSPAGDIILVLCRTGDSLSMLLVDMHDPGVGVSAPDLKMGNHAQLTADVRFENVFVPDDHLIGSEGGAALRSRRQRRAGSPHGQDRRLAAGRRGGARRHPGLRRLRLRAASFGTGRGLSAGVDLPRRQDRRDPRGRPRSRAG